MLLILDEVQTGMGRTGKWFAYQHSTAIEPGRPDLAKALAGGIAAGVMIAKPQVAEVLKPGMHASTFGGNPIACRAGLATIETIEEEGLLERGAAIGERFRSQFEALRAELPDLIREIRILGVMIGLDLTFDATDVGCQLPRSAAPDQRHARHVVRLLPALTDHRTSRSTKDAPSWPTCSGRQSLNLEAKNHSEPPEAKPKAGSTRKAERNPASVDTVKGPRQAGDRGGCRHFVSLFDLSADEAALLAIARSGSSAARSTAAGRRCCWAGRSAWSSRSRRCARGSASRRPWPGWGATRSSSGARTWAWASARASPISPG